MKPAETFFDRFAQDLDMRGVSRQAIVGVDLNAPNALGPRMITYADYTASGRAYGPIEDMILEAKWMYGNTHTESSSTGAYTTALYQQAIKKIKDAFGVDDDYIVVSRGAGSSGAIRRFQQILGIGVPSPSIALLERLTGLRESELRRQWRRYLPVVFVGPYEHHSNEISWRVGLCEVVRIQSTEDGLLDLEDLAKQLARPEFNGRMKIGSFSAGSNVTGLKTDILAVIEVLKAHDAIVCFDCAARAPYEKIDMMRLGIDAVFVSMHKFLGGIEASGLLIFHKKLYKHCKAPTNAAGGTVDFVNKDTQDFIDDIQVREDGGTPAILGTIRSALALMVRDHVGTKAIDRKEHDHLRLCWEKWSKSENIVILGNQNLDVRLPIVSFRIKDEQSGYDLHPQFVTRLLDDLFGIQARAGCSCAGPYGHDLLQVDDSLSDKYRRVIAEGYHGLKPGWTRVGFHFTMDGAEVTYICEAVSWIAKNGHRVLPVYRFDVGSGMWMLRDDVRFPKYPFTAQVRTREERMLWYQRRFEYVDMWLSEMYKVNTFTDQKAVLSSDLLEELRYFTLLQENVVY